MICRFKKSDDAFADVIRRHQYTCYACAIMPDHVHLVIRKHRHMWRGNDRTLPTASRGWRGCFVDGLPSSHPVWTKGGWDRYLDSPEAIRGRIRYVEGNPEKEGLPRQEWPFVVAYDGWPFHKRRQR